MSDKPEAAARSRFRLTPSRAHLMRHVVACFKEPLPLAYSAANPQCRMLAETFGSERLSKINLTHISTFNAANHCGVGLKERYNIVRVPCTPFSGPSHTPPDRSRGLVLMLDPPVSSVNTGASASAVVIHSPQAGEAGGTPRFEVRPCPRDDVVVRDPVDHTYPFNTTRGVFSLEGLGDLEGGERYGRRQGCVQNYLGSLTDGASNRKVAPHEMGDIVLVFLWVEREQGTGAHGKALRHVHHARWWLARPPGGATASSPRRDPAPVFLHVYNGGERSLFRNLLCTVPAVRGLMCIHSPWFAAGDAPAGAMERTPAEGGAPGKIEDPFDPHDDEGDRYMDIGTALSQCETEDEARQLRALRYFGVSATPLTSEGLTALLGRLSSLRHLAIYLNHANQFRSVGCLGGLEHLERLTIHTCPSLTSLVGIEESPALLEVNLTACINLASITPLAGLPTLRSIRVNGCAAVAPSPFMEAILSSPKLLSPSASLPHHPALQCLSYLQLSELDNSCDNLSALRHLPLLTALDLHLTATDNNAVVVIAKNCIHLQALSLAECFLISEIEPLAALPRLSHLLLRNTTITDVSLKRFCDAAPPSLRVLDVSECDDLTDCRCAAAIPTLTRINAQGTQVTPESVYELVKEVIVGEGTLRTVDVRGCAQLRQISAMFTEKATKGTTPA